MKAAEHTETMIRWWRRAGVERADLAARRATGAMIWHYDLSLDALPLAWARAQNVQHAEIYIRPARGYGWPLVFLDDVPVATALRVARRYGAMVVQTSPAGGCHIWLLCDRPLDETCRKQAQRWLAAKLGADPGSISGEHLGRLAGFKNWKRAGCWVNVLAAKQSGCLWDSTIALGRARIESALTAAPMSNHGSGSMGRDTSPSGREWGWVCSMLEAGEDSHSVYFKLVQKARHRRGDDAERYARRTVEKALQHVGHR